MMAHDRLTRKSKASQICLICGLLLVIVFSLPAPDVQGQTKGLLPAGLNIVPNGANFQIMDNTGHNTIMGKPAIAFDQTNFMVGWTQGINPTDTKTKIYASRISLAGVVIDPAGIAVSIQLNQQVGPPSVIFDGTQYVMIWAAMRNGIYELYGARILPNGTVLDPGGVVLTSGGDPLESRKIGLAYTDGITMLIWRTSGSIVRGARITSSAGLHNLDAPAGFQIGNRGAQAYPSVATDGNIFLVTWRDGPTYEPDLLNIYGTRVTKDGTVLDPDSFVICNETGDQDQTTVGFNGQNFWVVWYTYGPNNDSMHGSLYGARVLTDGTVLDKPAIKIAERMRGQMPPQINCQGQDCLVVWDVEYANIGENFRLTDVYARRITADGQVLDPEAIPVSTSVGHQFSPVIGYGEGHYLVAWSDSTGMRNYDGSIWGQVLVEQTQSVGMPLAEPSIATKRSPLPSQAATWSHDTVPVNYYLSDGIAFGANNSQAFGDKQRVFLRNGSWQSESVFDEGSAWASWGQNPNDIWIGGWCGGVEHFNGVAWEDAACTTLPNMRHDISGIWGTADDHIWATADTGLITSHDPSLPYNFGWKTTVTGTPYDLEDIWGFSGSDIYAVGERGTILHYNGTRWSQVANIPTIQTLNAIWGYGPHDIFVVGDWGLILHYDGNQWTQQNTGSYDHLFDVWGFNGQDVYAAGFSGKIFHYDGTSWTLENTGSTQDLLSIWGTMDLSAKKKIVWASGNGPIILKSEQTINLKYQFLPYTRK